MRTRHFILASIFALGLCATAALVARAEEKTLTVDVFYSMRSPYCYIALDRILEMRQKYHVNVNLRIVYPIAIKDPGWFQAANK